MEDKRQVVPGVENNRDVTTTLGVQKAKGGLGKVLGGLGSLLVLVGFIGSNLPKKSARPPSASVWSPALSTRSLTRWSIPLPRT